MKVELADIFCSDFALILLYLEVINIQARFLFKNLWYSGNTDMYDEWGETSKVDTSDPFDDS